MEAAVEMGRWGPRLGWRGGGGWGTCAGNLEGPRGGAETQR